MQHVGADGLDASDLDRLTQLASQPSEGPAQDLTRTLLIIPCSGGKDGAADPGFPQCGISDYVTSSAAAMIQSGREEAFRRPGTLLDTSSPLRPALAWYTGQPYKTGGVREGLVTAMRLGLHCLILSGGYGIVLPQEPIHSYRAHISKTRSVWSNRTPQTLRDYVANNHILRSIGTYSSQ